MPIDDTDLLKRAAILCDEGHFAEAGNLLRSVAEQEPSNVEVWVLLARAELAAGRYTSALQAAERTQVLIPEESLPYLIASIALRNLGRPDEAVEHARQAVSVDQEDRGALSWLARLLVVAGSLDEAKEVAARVVKLAPEWPEAHLTAGVIAAAAGEREVAKASFREVLALDPASSAAQHELARLRLRRKANHPAVLTEAAAGFARAVSVDPEAHRSRLSLELVLRVFLSKTAYLLFVDAYVAGRVTAGSDSVAARLVPGALLTVPVYYAGRFLRHLTPELRQRLMWMLIGERVLSTAATLEGVAALGILSASVVSVSLRPSISVSRPWLL